MQPSPSDVAREEGILQNSYPLKIPINVEPTLSKMKSENVKELFEKGVVEEGYLLALLGIENNTPEIVLLIDKQSDNMTRINAYTHAVSLALTVEQMASFDNPPPCLVSFSKPHTPLISLDGDWDARRVHLQARTQIQTKLPS
eukprot:m.129509 g.129509  ORF g.129509 m.129509 type:complete len:143 (+) comp9461_c0_seq9:1189-1617(+)